MALSPSPPPHPTPRTPVGGRSEGTNSDSASKQILAAVKARDRTIERQRQLLGVASKVLAESSAEIAVGAILQDGPAIVEAEKLTLWLLEDMSFHGYSSRSGVQVLPGDVGVPGYIMKTGECLNVPDIRDRPELLTTCEAQFGSCKFECGVAVLAAPVHDEFGAIVGVLEARQKTCHGSPSSAPFTASDEKLLFSIQVLISQQVRIAELTNAKMKADLRTDNALSLMDNICRTGTLDEVVGALSLAANDLIDCQASLVFLKEKTSLICYANSAYDSEDHDRSHELRLSSSEPVFKEVLATGRPLVVNRDTHSEDLDRLSELLEDTLTSAGLGETRRDRGSVSMVSIASMSCILQAWPTYIKSVLCSPLRGSDGEVFGVVLAVNRRRTPNFASEALGSSSAGPSGPSFRPDNGAAVLSALLRSNLSTCDSLQAPSAAMEVEVGDFLEADEMQLSLLLRLSSHVIQISRLLNEQQRTARRKEALLTLVSDGKSALADKDPRRFAVEIVAKSLIMFECDRCTFFTVDTLNDELVGYYTADGKAGLQELRLPIRGIAGTVAKSNTMLNIPDAWADERFSNEVDLRMNYRTKTLLCAPLATSSGKVIAILQCINKKANLVFNEEDEQMLLTVSALLSDMLQRMMLEGGYASFVQFNDNINSDVKDMFSQYQKEAPKAAEPEAQPAARKVVSASRLRLHRAVSTMTDVTQGVKQLRRWDLDVVPLVEDSNRLLTNIRACFSYYGLLVRFNIAADVLDQAVQAIRTRYYANVHYHNWTHAFATMHATFLLLETAAFSSLLPESDVLALLLSALGHDVEHPGYTNAFMVNSRSRLAIVYNDRAVLESHHASVTTSIVECDTKLLAAMTKEDVQRVRQVVVQTILGTDMALHQDCIQWLETETSNLDLPSHRSAEDQLTGDAAVRLATAMLHSADLVHPALTWSVHRQRSIQIASEFFDQFEEETSLGLPTLPFMGKVPTNLNALAPIQTGFIQFVAMPLWSALNTAAGNDLLHPLLDNISENRKQWQRLCDGEELEEQAPFKVPVFAETRGAGFASSFRRGFVG